MSNFKLDAKTIIIGLIIVVAAIWLLPQLFNTSSITDTATQQPVNNAPADTECS